VKNVNEVADIEAVVKNYSKLMIPSSLLMMSSTSVLKLALGGGSGGAPRHSVSGRKPIGGSACSGPGAHSTRIQLRIKVQVANLKIRRIRKRMFIFLLRLYIQCYILL
jgi:hypothetical protein